MKSYTPAPPSTSGISLLADSGRIMFYSRLLDSLHSETIKRVLPITFGRVVDSSSEVQTSLFTVATNPRGDPLPGHSGSTLASAVVERESQHVSIHLQIPSKEVCSKYNSGR